MFGLGFLRRRGTLGRLASACGLLVPGLFERGRDVTVLAKGKPDGPPPMPLAGKLKLDPVVKARRPNAVTALAASPWAPSGMPAPSLATSPTTRGSSAASCSASTTDRRLCRRRPRTRVSGSADTTSGGASVRSSSTHTRLRLTPQP